MIRKRLLNQIFFALVVTLSAFLLFSRANVMAQQADPAEEEQEVDLDSLDEDLDQQSEDKSANEEKFLPMYSTSVEVKRHSALALVALAALMPLSTLLFPLDRMRKGGRPQSRRNRKTNS